MAFRKTLCALVAAAALTIGCSAGEKKQIDWKTVEGIPKSVQVVAGTHSTRGLSSMIEIEKGKYLLCYTGSLDAATDYTNAAAVIESEMNDGDQEKVKMTGTYHGDKFYIKSVTANGYTIDVGGYK